MNQQELHEFCEDLRRNGCSVEETETEHKCMFFIDQGAVRADLDVMRSALISRQFSADLMVHVHLDDGTHAWLVTKKPGFGPPIPEPDNAIGRLTRIEDLASEAYRSSPSVRARFRAWRSKGEWKRIEDYLAELRAERDPWLYKLGDVETEFVRSIDDLVESAFKRCGSPIEELFLATLSLTRPLPALWRWNVTNAGQVGLYQERLYENVACGECARVFAQYQIQNFRVDFAIVAPDARVVVELDGHEFHERTKEQAEADKSRDRALQLEGWRVFRFTGSEIWRDPVACTRQALEGAGIK